MVHMQALCMTCTPTLTALRHSLTEQVWEQQALQSFCISRCTLLQSTCLFLERVQHLAQRSLIDQLHLQQYSTATRSLQGLHSNHHLVEATVQASQQNSLNAFTHCRVWAVARPPCLGSQPGHCMSICEWQTISACSASTPS